VILSIFEYVELLSRRRITSEPQVVYCIGVPNRINYRKGNIVKEGKSKILKSEILSTLNVVGYRYNASNVGLPLLWLTGRVKPGAREERAEPNIYCTSHYISSRLFLVLLSPRILSLTPTIFAKLGWSTFLTDIPI
jgi:hypothetical protein